MNGDDLQLDVGALLHMALVGAALGRPGDAPVEGDFEPVLRRARLRFEGTIYKRFAVVLQTDRGTGESGSGITFNLIDAFARMEITSSLFLTAGLHLPPGPRSSNETSANLLMIDRPTLGFKSISWGMRTLSRFNGATLESSDSTLRTNAPVRDLGVTLHGLASLGSKVEGKLAVGVYQGIERDFSRAPHLAARLQLTVGDREPGLIVRGNYGGKKALLAFGAFYETQPDIARTVAGQAVTPHHGGLDAFFEQPAGPGSMTFEGGVSILDLGGQAAVVSPRADAPRDFRRTEGVGAYVQAGYFIPHVAAGLQPWIGAETFRASVPEGNFSAVRAGASLFLVPAAVSLRAGFELFGAPGSPNPQERLVQTVSVGAYLAL